MATARWVFDCDVPLDHFGARMRAALERRGWTTGPAQAHDFACARGGRRAWVKLVYHDWGVQVHAKMKPGLLRGLGPLQRELWEAAREAQVGATPTSPPASVGTTKT